MENPKKIVAERALMEIRPGDVVGLGTGTTAAEFIKLLGASEVAKKIVGVPTSLETEFLARSLGIKLVDINEVDHVDVTVDGADEVDPNKNLIKGGGGALTREKIVAHYSKKYIIIVTNEKMVPKIPFNHPIPIEVLPFSYAILKRELEYEGLMCLRRDKFITDNGNYILDCTPSNYENHDIFDLYRKIKLKQGVVECGIFTGFNPIIFNYKNGMVEEI